MIPFQTVLVNRTDKTIRYTTQPSITLIPGAEVRLPYDVFTKFAGDVNTKLLLRDIKEGRVLCAGVVHRDAFCQIVTEPIFESSCPPIETTEKAAKPEVKTIEDVREPLPFGKTPDDVIKHVPAANGFDGNNSKPIDESKDWGVPPAAVEVKPAPAQIVDGPGENAEVATSQEQQPTDAPVSVDVPPVLSPSDVLGGDQPPVAPVADAPKKRGGRKAAAKL